MKYILVPTETQGVFLTRPSEQTLRETKRAGHVLAKVTYEVRDDNDVVCYTACVSEHYDDKHTTRVSPNGDYSFDTEEGALQTKIIIKCSGSEQEASEKLNSLSRHLSAGFYVSHPYVIVLGASYNREPYLEIAKIAPLFADTIWERLQSYADQAFSAAFIAELQARIYPRVYVPSQQAVYTQIQSLIAEGKHAEAVDAAYAVANRRNEYDYLVDTTNDCLYQTGVLLQDVSPAESNRAFRLLSKMDMHVLHLLAKKQLTQVATAKLSDVTLQGAPRANWNRSLIGDLSAGTTPGASQDAYLEAMQALLTKDGKLEMDPDQVGGAEYGHAIARSLGALKGKTFDGSSLAGTLYSGDTAPEVEFGFAVMLAALDGLGAALEAASADKQSTSSQPGAKPRPGS